MSRTRWWLGAAVGAGLLTCCLPGDRTTALEPVFTTEGIGTREVRVCILLLQATAWENPEPFFLPTLATNRFQRVRNVRPAGWTLVNPLAPTTVTEEIANLWNWRYNGPVTFDGVTADVENDIAGGPAANFARYNNGPAGGPNTYLVHSNPNLMVQFGVGGAGDSFAPALPAVGEPVPQSHPAYWEVPLTPITVSQLANFDAVFVNTHRNLRFTQEEQILLRQFLDQGGTLYLEDSHGCRLITPPGQETDPNAVDFFLPFQFVDGWPGNLTGNTRSYDGYPLNPGSVGTQTPSKQVIAPNHPLLNSPNPISAAEADVLGDVRAWDHLIIRNTPSVYLIEELLRTVNPNGDWGDSAGTGTNEPALAVARVGSGRLVLSGIDMIDDCSQPWEVGTEPTNDAMPDIKFMINLLAWQGGVGGNRRGGAFNQGVGAGKAVRTLTPKFVFHWPDGGPGPDFYASDIAHDTPDPVALASDLNYRTKEPLVAANGVVYLQYEESGTYWLVAVDSDAVEDRDGDGNPDDGPVRDLTNAGATFDVLWLRNMGNTPILGATVVSITHENVNVPVEVLLCSQVEATDTIRLSALHATVDVATNALTGQNPGDWFYNWTSASPNWVGPSDGFVLLDCQGELVPTRCSPPVVYDDHVFVVGSTNFGYAIAAGGAVPAGEYAKLFAVRLVFDPGAGVPTGSLTFSYPDLAAPGEAVPSLDPLNPSPRYWAAQQALKLVDVAQNHRYGVPTGPNFILGGPADSQIGAGSAAAVPTVPDPTNLLPVAALIRDARTGLVSPTVFLNRSGGDVFAVNAFPAAMGWRIEGDIQSLNDVNSVIDENGVVIYQQPPVPANPLISLTHVEDSNGNVIATELRLAPAEWRSRRPFTAIALDYVLSNGRRVQEERVIYPLYRLLRGERHSGYETTVSGVIDLLSWSTGAPMVYSADTVVGTSSALWLGVNQPAAQYEPIGSMATLGVGQQAAGGGVTEPAGYQPRASGPVTFYDATADAVQQDDTDVNHRSAIRWVFDPGVLMPQQYPAEVDANPNTLLRAKFSCYGSAVRYGDSAVVAGQVLAPDGQSVQDGMLIAVDPQPVLTAPIRFNAGAGLRSDLPVYLLCRDPATIADNTISSIDTATPSYQQQAAFVVDPGQYILDYGSSRLHLRGPDAHLSRLRTPALDSDAAGFEPFPEAYRAPLYGRRLWLVQDANKNGLNDGPGVDPVAEIYVPMPVKWIYRGNQILLASREFINAATIVVAVAGAGAPLVAGTDYFLPDPDRPHLITFAPGNYEGQTVYVEYDDVTGAAHRERHRVPAPVPGFSFSPLVAGDRIFISGTQMGNLAVNPIPPTVPGVGPNGGLYAFRFTGIGQVVEADRLGPDSADLWPNYTPPALEATYVRGLPVAAEGELYVTFGIDGAAGPADSDDYIAPLYALGTQELLVTESLRVSRVGYDGEVSWQLTGTTERNGAARENTEENNNPPPAELLTTLLARPSKAVALPSDRLLLVDTGNDRVVEVDPSGLVVWPVDADVNSPDVFLRYQGLFNFGLRRPTDAARYLLQQAVNPGSQYDVNGDGNVNAADVLNKDVTVIADRGNHRIVQVVSHPIPLGNQGTGTYYEPLVWGAPGFGSEWALTAPRVNNPVTNTWVELPWSEVQVWSPGAGEPNYDAPNAAWHHYVVARAEGWDQLFRIDPDPDNDGILDGDLDNQVDGLSSSLTSLVDDWTQGRIFRGLRGFHRFRVGTDGYLAIIEQDQNAGDGSQVVNVYALNGPGGGVTPTGWSFGPAQYGEEVYDSPGNLSYYERALGDFTDALLPLRFDRWYAGGQKQWNPRAVRKLPFQNVLAIVNGASNSVNQTGSNSEVLLVRFNPDDPPASPVRYRVEHVLPDLAVTTTYPAGQAASRRRPSTGSYPVSSPVFAAQ